MPLLDHFHRPLSEERHGESFHASWANEIMAGLNQGGLPAGYFAETQVHMGSRVEVDVASFQRPGPPPVEARDNGGGVVAVAAPPVASVVMPAVFPDEIEVQVFHSSGGSTLVGAIELISPGNKDRMEARRSFAAKCLGYLQMGIGLVIVDVVTERLANLHDELVRLLEQEPRFHFPAHPLLYTVAYRPFRTGPEGDQIEIWPVPLVVGQALPAMPLALRGGPTVMVELEESYTRTRERSLL